MKRDEILDEAKRLTTGDRQADYGDASESFTKVGIVWGVILDTPAIGPATVALMMSALKIIRATESPAKADNWVDLAGYAALGGEIAGGQPAGQCPSVHPIYGRCCQGYVHSSLHEDEVGHQWGLEGVALAYQRLEEEALAGPGEGFLGFGICAAKYDNVVGHECRHVLGHEGPHASLTGTRWL